MSYLIIFTSFMIQYQCTNFLVVLHLMLVIFCSHNFCIYNLSANMDKKRQKLHSLHIHIILFKHHTDIVCALQFLVTISVSTISQQIQMKSYAVFTYVITKCLKSILCYLIACIHKYMPPCIRSYSLKIMSQTTQRYHFKSTFIFKTVFFVELRTPEYN